MTLVQFVRFAALALVAAFAGLTPVAAAVSGSARFTARPGLPTKIARTGLHELGLARVRDAWLSVPQSYSPGRPVPLILMLHGARGKAGLEEFCDRAAERGIAVLIPDSRAQTWDVIVTGFGTFGPDIAFIDRALRATFDSIAVDPRRIAVAGFSDGASYALCLGLANGDLFTHVIAYSPGGLAPPSVHGRPSIFLAHGVYDKILPIKTSSREVLSRLLQTGYAVTYKEFRGGHEIDSGMVDESLGWLLGGSKP
jgi:phospholipase/carboxylesterase